MKKIYVVMPSAFCDDYPEAIFLDYRKAAYYCHSHANEFSTPCIEVFTLGDESIDSSYNLFVNLSGCVTFDSATSTYNIASVYSHFTTCPDPEQPTPVFNSPCYRIETVLPISHPYALPDFHDYAIADCFWAYMRKIGDPCFQSPDADYSLFSLPPISAELQKNNPNA